MPGGRIELPWIAPPVPKTGASTNFAIPANNSEARTGIEPVHGGFADRCVTTSPPSQTKNQETPAAAWTLSAEASAQAELRHPANRNNLILFSLNREFHSGVFVSRFLRLYFAIAKYSRITDHRIPAEISSILWRFISPRSSSTSKNGIDFMFMCVLT